MAQILVAYDIVSNKRRNKVAKFLEQYGVRLNKSVFLCNVQGINSEQLVNELKLSAKKADVICVFSLCKACIETAEMIGVTVKTTRETATQIV